MKAESRNNRSGRSGQKAADGQNTEDIEGIAEIREAALRILDYADNTARELVRKLQKKGYRYDQIELLVRNLVKAGLVDDVRYAESYVRVKTEAGKGPAWIRKKLIEKGIPRDQVENAFFLIAACEGVGPDCCLLRRQGQGGVGCDDRIPPVILIIAC